MEICENNGFKSIHFIGIGGVSMSALAFFMLKKGVFVSGSDQKPNNFTEKLEQNGALIYLGHNESNIPYNTELVVYTGAVKSDNPEYKEAIERKIALMERSEFLGYVSKMYKNVIAVSGTHGKTTTTSMIGEIFIRANLKPTIHLGGECENFGGNFYDGGGDIFITEACEYRNSFRFLNPSMSLITNIEKDHTDYYKNMQEISLAFAQFANNSSTVVVFENREIEEYIDKKVNIVHCGFDENNEIVGFNLKKHRSGCYSFDVRYNNVYIGHFDLSVMGMHNAKNALCAIAISLLYNADYGSMYHALKNFRGVKRRYEMIGEYKGVPVVCDYAHHPTEIVNSIKGALTSHKKILCIFQPHTYTRTLALIDEFATCFKGVHRLVIYKTYPARENPIDGGRAIDLLNSVKNMRGRKFYCYSKKCLERTLKDMDKTYDLILVLGAGDIYEVCKKIIAKL